MKLVVLEYTRVDDIVLVEMAYLPRSMSISKSCGRLGCVVRLKARNASSFIQSCTVVNLWFLGCTEFIGCMFDRSPDTSQL